MALWLRATGQPITGGHQNHAHESATLLAISGTMNSTYDVAGHRGACASV